MSCGVWGGGRGLPGSIPAMCAWGSGQWAQALPPASTSTLACVKPGLTQDRASRLHTSAYALLLLEVHCPFAARRCACRLPAPSLRQASRPPPRHAVPPGRTSRRCCHTRTRTCRGLRSRAATPSRAPAPTCPAGTARKWGLPAPQQEGQEAARRGRRSVSQAAAPSSSACLPAHHPPAGTVLLRQSRAAAAADCCRPRPALSAWMHARSELSPWGARRAGRGGALQLSHHHRPVPCSALLLLRRRRCVKPSAWWKACSSAAPSLPPMPLMPTPHTAARPTHPTPAAELSAAPPAQRQAATGRARGSHRRRRAGQGLHPAARWVGRRGSKMGCS